MLLPFIFLLGGAVIIALLVFKDDDRPVPVHEPDLPAFPLPPSPESAPTLPSTKYKKVDTILGELQKASQSSGIPLGLMVGWIARESGGKLSEITKLDERGYFQLMPAESKALGLDHKKLSTDSQYSINAGLMLIAKYMGLTDKLNIAPKGTDFYWKVVKLNHTMGSGATKKIVQSAKAAGAAGTWSTLRKYALDNNDMLFRTTKHSPAKWFPLVDQVYVAGAPYGFGDTQQVVVGAVFHDIVDPLDVIKKG